MALPDRSSATPVAHLLRAAQTPSLSPHPPYSLDVFLLSLSLSSSPSPAISKSICLSRWRVRTARRRLSIPFNLACKCRLNIFRRPAKPSTSSRCVVRRAIPSNRVPLSGWRRGTGAGGGEEGNGRATAAVSGAG